MLSPYPSHRVPVYGDAIVATSQPLAAQAGMAMFERGGNAVDAALAAAIALTVVEPTSNGLGSDAFALVWDGSALQGLNASGRSPAGLTRDKLGDLETMPLRGWLPVTVPGAVSGWVALSDRYGLLDFEELFDPAIRLAREGFPVSPITAAAWGMAAWSLGKMDDFARDFLRDGSAPAAGDRWRFPAQARTLEAIASSHGDAMYVGELAGRIADHAAATGGLLTRDDLASHEALWVDPISVKYGDVELFEIPPNGQGLAALIALGILDRCGLDGLAVDSVEGLHLQAEAMKLGFADAHRYVADPDHLDVVPEALLAAFYLDARAGLIDRSRAQNFGPGVPKRGGTVYLTAADPDGRMVSFIQSNYWGFGSGIVVPDTGISLQNRGAGFTLEGGHPNVIGPAKRPFHTIIPGFAFRRGKPWLSFGVMGGPMQPQGHIQMITRMATWGQDPQAASDAPRWRVVDDGTLHLEHRTSADVAEGLAALGHDVHRASPVESALFGGAQLIERLPDGGYRAGSDHRKDGHAVAR